ncbi:hypothetical protein P9112_003872 [Eukaryota sp. TZLM1-RC]
MSEVGETVLYADLGSDRLLSELQHSCSNDQRTILQVLEGRCSESQTIVPVLASFLTRGLIHPIRYAHNLLSNLLRSDSSSISLLYSTIRPTANAISKSPATSAFPSRLLHLASLPLPSLTMDNISPIIDDVVFCLGSVGYIYGYKMDIKSSDKAMRHLDSVKSYFKSADYDLLNYVIDHVMKGLKNNPKLIGILISCLGIISFFKPQFTSVLEVYLNYLLFPQKSTIPVFSLFRPIIQSNLIDCDWVAENVLGQNFARMKLRAPEIVGKTIPKFLNDCVLDLSGLQSLEGLINFGFSLVDKEGQKYQSFSLSRDLLSVAFFSSLFPRINQIFALDGIINQIFDKLSKSPNNTKALYALILKQSVDYSGVEVTDLEVISTFVSEKLAEILHKERNVVFHVEAMLDTFKFSLAQSNISSKLEEIIVELTRSKINSHHVIIAICDAFDANSSELSRILSPCYEFILENFQKTALKPAYKLLTLTLGCLLSMIAINDDCRTSLLNDEIFVKFLNFEFFTEIAVNDDPHIVALSVSHLSRHILTRLYTEDRETLFQSVSQTNLIKVLAMLLTNENFFISECTFNAVSCLLNICPNLHSHILAKFCDYVIDLDSPRKSTVVQTFSDLLTFPLYTMFSLDCCVSILLFVSCHNIDPSPPSFTFRFLRLREDFSKNLKYQSYSRVISQLTREVTSGNQNRSIAAHSLFKCNVFTSLLPQEDISKSIKYLIIEPLSTIQDVEFLLSSHDVLFYQYSELEVPLKELSKRGITEWKELDTKSRNIYAQKLELEAQKRREMRLIVDDCFGLLKLIESFAIGFRKQSLIFPCNELLTVLFNLCQSKLIEIRELAAKILHLLSLFVPYTIVEASIRTQFAVALNSTQNINSEERGINHPQLTSTLLIDSLVTLSGKDISFDDVTCLFYGLPLISLLVKSHSDDRFLNVQNALTTNQSLSLARQTLLKFSESQHMSFPFSIISDLLIDCFISTKLPAYSEALCTVISKSDYQSMTSLVKFMTHDDVEVRRCVLQAILSLPKELFKSAELTNEMNSFDLPSINPPIHFNAFILSHDDVADDAIEELKVKNLAVQLFELLPWNRNFFDRKRNRLTGHFSKFLLEHLTLPNVSEFERRICANSFIDLFFMNRNEIPEIFNDLISSYHKLFNQVYPPLSDAEMKTLGLPESQRQRVPSRVISDRTSLCRQYLMVATGELSSKFSDSDKFSFLQFLLDKALADPVKEVTQSAISAGSKTVESLSKSAVDDVYTLFSERLESLDPDNSDDDKTRVGIVALLGSLACLLEPNDSRVELILSNLMDALLTPSAFVQRTVCQTLPNVVGLISKDQHLVVYQQLLENLQGDSFGQRKGGAFGLAGLVKGLGVRSLKEFGLIDTLNKMIQSEDKLSREAVLMVLECLSDSLGKVFEPYIIPFIPKLLSTLSDTSPEVREAALSTSAVVVKQISIPGVKLILPSLIDGLLAQLWRTKVGATTLIKTFVEVAPRQIATSLPEIIPKLANLVVDPHVRVAESAESCLKQISDIITAVDLKPLSSTLIDAICHPADKTGLALSRLASAALESSIDAPSLSLLIPIIFRGMGSRSFEAKKNSCIVSTSVVQLTSSKDILPYVAGLIEELKKVIIDPIPQVRSASASLCYSLCKRVSISSVSTLLEWCLNGLNTDSLPVVRNGSAQAYAALISAGGRKVLEESIPEILSRISDPDTSSISRDGNVQVIMFIPPHYSSKKFSRYVGDVLAPITMSFQNEAEFVRDSAIKAFRSLTKLYVAPQSPFISLFLRALSSSLIHYNWRSRVCAANVVIDLLLALGNLKLKRESESQEISLPDHEVAIIEKSMGRTDYLSVMARLLFIKCDYNPVVRQVATNVWKALVRNTGRIIKFIFPTFVAEVLLPYLGEDRGDVRQTLVSVLHEICLKFHEELFLVILPPLLDYLASDQSTARELVGAATMVSTVISNVTSPEVNIALTQSNLISALQTNLSHSNPAVRKATANATSAVISRVGESGAKMILPDLLKRIQLSEDENEKKVAISALSDLLSENVSLLDGLVPELLNNPSNDNLEALAALVRVAESNYLNYLEQTVLTLVNFVGFDPSSLKQSALTYLDSKRNSIELVTAVFNSVSPFICDTLVSLFYKCLDSENIKKRIGACLVMKNYHVPVDVVGSLEVNWQRHHLINDLLRGLFPLLSSRIEFVREIALDSLTSHLKPIQKDNSNHLVTVIDCLSVLITGNIDNVTGKVDVINNVNAIRSFIHVITAGLLSTEDHRIRASNFIYELSQVVDPVNLKPFLMGIGGPLIRNISESHPFDLYVSVLTTLRSILLTNGTSLRAFIGPLQTAIIKPLSHANSKSRKAAIKVIESAMPYAMRVDPFVNELCTRVTSSEYTSSIKNDYLAALSTVIYTVGGKVSEAGRKLCLSILLDHVTDQQLGKSAAICMASYLCSAKSPEFEDLMNELVLDPVFGATVSISDHSIVCQNYLISHLLRLSFTLDVNYLSKIVHLLLDRSVSDNENVRNSVANALGFLLNHSNARDLCNVGVDLSEVCATLAILMTDDLSIIRQTALLSCYRVCLHNCDLIQSKINLFLPALLPAIQVRNPEQRRRAELTLCMVLETDKGPDKIDSLVGVVSEENVTAVKFYYEKVLSKINLEGLGDVDSDTENRNL